MVKVSNWMSHLEYDWNNPVWQPWLETGRVSMHFIATIRAGAVFPIGMSWISLLMPWSATLKPLRMRQDWKNSIYLPCHRAARSPSLMRPDIPKELTNSSCMAVTSEDRY